MLKLLETLPFQEITIQKIADEAIINRATFYFDHTDKYDLLDSLVEERFSAFRNTLIVANHVSGGTLYPDRFVLAISAVFEMVEKEAHFFRVLLANQTTNNIKERFMEMASVAFTSQFEVLFGKDETKRAMPKELFLAFIVSGITGTIFWWIEQNQPYTPKEMATYLLHLIMNGPAKTMGLQISQEHVNGQIKS